MESDLFSHVSQVSGREGCSGSAASSSARFFMSSWLNVLRGCSVSSQVFLFLCSQLPGEMC